LKPAKISPWVEKTSKVWGKKKKGLLPTQLGGKLLKPVEQEFSNLLGRFTPKIFKGVKRFYPKRTSLTFKPQIVIMDDK